MSDAVSFALNHMTAPGLGLSAFFDLALELGIRSVEIRNDLAGNVIADGTPAKEVARLAGAKGIEIISINALYPFNDWNDDRAERARELVGYAAECGARAIVLCPLNDKNHRPDFATRAAKLRTALSALDEILRGAGIIGLVEPLGFEECSLRVKREAVDAITELGVGDRFKLVHDTFHHYLSGETEIFPDHTGLVHISGVEDETVPPADIRDGHRVLVGAKDIMGNISQLRAILSGGYAGPLSFEPFAASVHETKNIAVEVRGSIEYIINGLK